MGLLSSALFVASSRTFLFRFLRRAPPSFGGRSLRSDAASDRSVAWPRVLLPLAVAASAGSALAFDLSRVSAPCLCDPGLESCVRRGDTDRVVKGSRTEVIDEFIRELKDVLQDNMTVDYEERFFHGTPQNSFHRAVNVPDVIVFPRSQDDVHKIVVVCNKYKVPIVPYGGATSIEGQTLSPHGGVCIDMSLMKKIKSPNVEDMDVVVEPGVGWIELNEYLKPFGLFFPLDPGPGATIGGMCATRCSGSLAVRNNA